MRSLTLAENQLTGQIPPELGRLEDLEWLTLSQNKLSGKIPDSLSSLTDLIWLSPFRQWVGRLYTNLAGQLQ